MAVERLVGLGWLCLDTHVTSEKRSEICGYLMLEKNCNFGNMKIHIYVMPNVVTDLSIWGECIFCCCMV